MTPEREAEIRAVLNGDQSVDMDDALTIVSMAADDLLDEVDRLREESMQRLARAAFHVDSTHHLHEGPDGRPTCSCGFIGDARKRTQTEHITAAVMEAFDHD